MDSTTKDVEELIKSIQRNTETVTKSSEEAVLKQNSATNQAKVIEEEKLKADSALMEALPVVEAAAEALTGSLLTDSKSERYHRCTNHSRVKVYESKTLCNMWKKVVWVNQICGEIFWKSWKQ